MKMKSPIEERAEVILSEAKIITVASVNEEGYPRPVAMRLMANKGVQELYFETKIHTEPTGKVQQFEKNSKAGVEFHNQSDSVTLLGDVEVISDLEKIKEVYSHKKNSYFVKTLEDERYRLLKFVTKRAIYTIDGRFTREDYLEYK
jgi:general stress protein 26